MSKTRTRTLVLGGLLALALMLPACTRSASTPPAEQGTTSSPLDSQQATMEAVRAALLTQTAQAEQAAPAATEVPTQVVAPPEETEEPDTEATAAQVEYVEYTVKPGDWLFMVAENFGVDPQAIVDLNGLTSDSQIQPGLVLKIPPSSGQIATPTASGTTVAGGTTHVVKPGEWVWQIARLYGVDPQDIIDANNLTNPGLIFPGMELVIP
ncbi:MAG TPA: LysM domain-containing protein [Anaerolineales bacterium]